MAEASAKRVIGDEPQGTMGRVQTAVVFFPPSFARTFSWKERRLGTRQCSKAKAPWHSFVVCPIPCRFALCVQCFACVRIPKSLIRICSHGQLFRSVYPGSLTVSPEWEHAVCLHHHACPPHLLRLGKDLSLFSLAPKGRRGHPCRLLCWIEQIRSLSRLSSVEE